MADVMLTTTDNPFSPFDQFDAWYTFDVNHGYCTCGYLARICTYTNSLPDSINDAAYEAAIDEILYYNLTGNYIKVTEDDYKDGKNPTNSYAPAPGGG